MTDYFDDNSRRDLIKYRGQRSKNALDEAALLFDNGYYDSAINELYYAAYFAASSLMLKYKKEAKTHADIKTMLGLYFVSNNLLSFDAGKTFVTLFDKRTNYEREDYTFCDSSTYLELRPLTEQFIKEVETLINKNN